MSEIAYSVDFESTKRFNCLCIQLVNVTKNGSQYQKEKSLSSSLSFWRSLCKNKQDQEILQLLIKEELVYQQKTLGKSIHIDSEPALSLLHISANESIPLLNKMGDTQKLFFREKQLVTDFFAKVDFFFFVKTLDSQRIEVHGKLKWRDKVIDLSDCDCVGPGRPLWFINGSSLRSIQTTLSWKEIQPLLASLPYILQGAEKSRFLNEYDDEDPEAPKIIFDEGAQLAIEHSLNSFPVLILKDRSGAFADLWMDYGIDQRISFDDPRTVIKDPHGKLLLKRNSEDEKNWEKDLLDTDFIRKPVSSSKYYCPIDKVTRSLLFLLEIGWVIHDFKGCRLVKESAVDVGVDESSQGVVVKGRVKFDEFEADLTDVIGAFNRRERFVQLNASTVGLLPPLETDPLLQELVEEGEIVGKEVKVKRSHFNGLSALLETSKLSPTISELKERWHSLSTHQELLPTNEFKGVLRHYQQEGLNWLGFLSHCGFHGILADEMGLGKTVQVLALLSTFPKESVHLIVMPTSLLFNWKNEIRRFLPGYPCYVHQGPDRATSLAAWEGGAIILTSYTTLRLDREFFEKKMFNSIILDEAQWIKNAHTQTAQTVFALNGTFRLCITGTPIENHLNEIWSHFHFLIPDLFGSETDFQADLLAAASDGRYLSKIKKKIAPFILRRRKQEVAKDLPERIDQIVWVEMEEGQRRLYDKMLTGYRKNLISKVTLEGTQKHRMEIFEALLRLRQICCHPLLVSASEDSEEEIPVSGKFEALLQDLETIVEENGKVLVYSQFTSMLHLMERWAQTKNISYCYLDGSTVNREEVVSRFQEDPSQNLFFISLRAGGVGLNLTAADYVFLYDPWWNEAVEEQAINRAHRIGRKDSVIAKRYVTVESIEEKMMKLKEGKRKMIDEVLDDGAGSIPLSLDELLELFS